MTSGGSLLLLLLFWADFALCSPVIMRTNYFEGNCAVFPDNRMKCGQPVDRFYYNIFSKNCEHFVDYGCRYRSNRFNTTEQCEEYCAPKNVCHLPPEEGYCSDNKQRWFFDTKTKSCKRLIYMGCRGNNNNNFERKSLCERTCL